MSGLLIRFSFIVGLIFSATMLLAQREPLQDDSLRNIFMPDILLGPSGDSSIVDTLIDSRIIVTIPQGLPFPPIDTLKKPRWPKSLQTGANVNQANFSENWKGGGKNTLALGLFLNSKLAHETPRTSFTNEVQLIYGIVKNEKLRSKKSADRIFIDTKLGYRITSQWNIFFSLNYVSQFDRGFRFSEDTSGNEIRTIISRFMSPGYLTTSFGIEFKPVEYFWIRFGTGTIRQTFVLDTGLYRNESQNYGVPVGKKIRHEVAFQVVANLDKEIAKNMTLKGRFMIFANYQNVKAIDSRVDVSLIAKVTKYIDVNLTGALLYDEDMDYKIQYSQALSLGILYSFTQFE